MTVSVTLPDDAVVTAVTVRSCKSATLDISDSQCDVEEVIKMSLSAASSLLLLLLLLLLSSSAACATVYVQSMNIASYLENITDFDATYH